MVFRIICLSGLLFLIGLESFSQVIPQKIPTDSISSDSLNQGPASDSTGIASILDSLRNIKPEIPKIDPNPPKLKTYQKVILAVKEQLPELAEEDTKLKLKLKFPWRDDIVIPLPKAFKKAGNRPPFDPDMAYQRSLIIPGWGQAYNKSYWKIPIFYAGYGVGIWWISYNNSQYQRHGIAYRCALGDIENCVLEPEFESFDPTGIRTRRDKFRRDRDFGVIVLAGWHLLHVIEAYVDAHLRGFDVSEDLSFQAKPAAVQPLPGSPVDGFVPGLGIQFAFSF